MAQCHTPQGVEHQLKGVYLHEDEPTGWNEGEGVWAGVAGGDDGMLGVLHDEAHTWER